MAQHFTRIHNSWFKL